MDTQLHNELAEIRATLAQMLPMVKESHTILLGNGGPGVVIKVDRLMRAYLFWRWVTGTAFGAVISAITIGVVEYLLHGKVL